MTTIILPALLAAAMVFGSAQGRTPAPQAAPPRFEVASVKPSKSGDGFVTGSSRGRRYQVTNIPLLDLIQSSFSVQPHQIVNAPDWTQNERYDITANIPADVDPASGVLLPMLRTLLEERFRLVTHWETRESSVLALVRARADGKLMPGLELASPECAPGGSRRLPPGPDGRFQLPPPGQRQCHTSSGIGSFTSGYITMESFARALTTRMERTVLDRTGLAGPFQFELTYAPITNIDVIDRRGVSAPALATALQEQLGLKLESTRASVEVLVIDSVARPTPD
jgi:uncharacterized protein (TIGR03435 family)